MISFFTVVAGENARFCFGFIFTPHTHTLFRRDLSSFFRALFRWRLLAMSKLQSREIVSYGLSRRRLRERRRNLLAALVLDAREPKRAPAERASRPGPNLRKVCGNSERSHAPPDIVAFPRLFASVSAIAKLPERLYSGVRYVMKVTFRTKTRNYVSYFLKLGYK